MSSSLKKREPFMAFVADDAMADMLRPVAEEQGWGPEKIHNGGLGNAVQTLSIASSPNILFIDLSDSADPLNDINSLAEVCEPGTVVIATGEVNDVRLFRDLVASGIQDYLLKPFTEDQLREVFANAHQTVTGPKVAEATVERAHVMTAVIGVRGGIGASTIATSVAWLLGNKSDRHTALLDLDVHFGSSAMALDLEPGRGLTDAIENPDRIDGLFIERAMLRANEKLSVLSAETPINQQIVSDGTAFNRLKDEMRNSFESTVIDLPRSMLIQYPELVRDVQVTVVVVELTLVATRDAIRLLSWLKTNEPTTRVIVVASRVPSGDGIEVSRKDFEKSIERKIDFVIPEDPKTVAQAAKIGKPLAEVAGTKTSLPLVQLAASILAQSGDAEVVQSTATADSSKSLFSGLKSRFAKKPKLEK